MRSLCRAVIAVVTIVALSLPAIAFCDVQEADAAQSQCNQWLRVVDISNYQGTPNFSQLAHSGVAGAYVLAADGAWTDPNYATDIAGLNGAGTPAGSYYFAETSQNPVASADFFAELMSAKLNTLPPALDLETNSGNLSTAGVVSWAQQFVVELEAKTGRVPTVYGGQYAWDYDNATNGVGLSAWPLWLAAYTNGYNPVANVCALGQPSVPGAWSSWSLWQFTSVASVFGISGHVDLSVVEPSWWETYTGQGIVPAGLSGNKWAQPVLVNGSIGPKVSQVQSLLVKAGVYHGPISGTLDDATEAAIQAWQVKLGIEPDGAWGPATARATASFFAFLASAVHLPKPPLHAGQHGTNVYRLQVALRALHYRVPTGGFYLASTVAAVAKFDNTCPGTHGWPGRSWHTHQNNCLAFYLGLAHKGVIR